MKKFEATARRFSANKQQAQFLIVCLIVLITSAGLLATRADSANRANGLTTAQAAPKPFKGEWIAELKDGRVRINFSSRSKSGGFSNSGSTFSLAELQGLPPEAMSSAKTTVNFKIVRDAGTFACEGYVGEGKGAGFWAFTPNRDFASAMRARGYGRLADDDLFSAALFNVGFKLVEELKAAGYASLSFEELLEAGMFNVTPEFTGAWRAAGFKNLAFEKLAELAMHDVKPEFILEMKAAGYANLTLDELIEARMFDVNGQLVKDM